MRTSELYELRKFSLSHLYFLYDVPSVYTGLHEAIKISYFVFRISSYIIMFIVVAVRILIEIRLNFPSMLLDIVTYDIIAMTQFT